MAEVGRPTVMDKDTLRKLEDAFSNDATDIQACFLANISTTALYDYQKEHPEFTERKNALKAMITYQAKRNLKDKVISGDTETSKWLLARKEKGEYSERLENTGKDGKDLIASPVLVKFLDDKPTNDNRDSAGV
jgi:hypothetical protein